MRRCSIVPCVLAYAALLAAPLLAEVRKLQSGAGPASWTNDLSAIQPSDWTYERAAHLLERAGFGGTPDDIEKLAKLTPQQAVNLLVDYESLRNDRLPAFDESGIFNAGMQADVDQHMVFGEALAKAYRSGSAYGVSPNADGIRRYQPVVDVLYYRLYSSPAEWNRATAWWAHRMLNTRRPLEEKMTLFWSGHFATEHAKVLDYRMMLVQQETFRKNAAGNFRTLLNEVTRDPAMLVYLDNCKNVKGHANENYAREVMELFALGVGNYTEDDIKEAARALTGFTATGTTSKFEPARHDEDIKTVLGEKGNFGPEDVIAILLRQKVAAEFISRKLYRFFVREDLTPETRTALAARLRETNYEFKPLLKAIFLSKDFYSPASYATQIKSPIQFQVSTYRKLGLTSIPGTPYFPVVMNNLGQNLGNPPNVKGWDGGRAWINPSTLLIRGNTVRHLLFPEEAADVYPRNLIPDRYVNAEKEAAMEASAQGKSLAAGGTGDETMMASANMAPSTKRLASAPDYNLKLGVNHGYTRTFATVKPMPPNAADLSLVAMARGAKVANAEDTVDYFVTRFLRLPLEEHDYALVLSFARRTLGAGAIDFDSSNMEHNLREVLHMVLSTPEYQIG